MANQRKSPGSGQRLREHDENGWDGVPGQERTKRSSQHPRKRWIKNKAGFSEAVIGPFLPTRIPDALVPLRSGIQPRGGVELEIVPGRIPPPKARRNDEQRGERRKSERKPFRAIAWDLGRGACRRQGGRRGFWRGRGHKARSIVNVWPVRHERSASLERPAVER